MSIDTAILEDCERQEGGVDRCVGFGKAPRGQVWTYVDWH